MFSHPRIAILLALTVLPAVGCSGLGRVVQASNEDEHAEKRAEEAAREHLESVYGKQANASFVGVFRREDGYIVLVKFVHNGAPDDAEFATIAISKDWEVVAVDYTDEGRRLKDPMAIPTEARENALPAETTRRLIRQAAEQNGAASR